jgi:hypothetical protein
MDPEDFINYLRLTGNGINQGAGLGSILPFRGTDFGTDLKNVALRGLQRNQPEIVPVPRYKVWGIPPGTSSGRPPRGRGWPIRQPRPS